jgi:hypothetical protein
MARASADVLQFPKGNARELKKLAILIRGTLGRIQMDFETACERRVEIGEYLVRAKELVGHGNWKSWIEQNFAWTERTALNFMNAYELKSEKGLSDLGGTLEELYRLAAQSKAEEKEQRTGKKPAARSVKRRGKQTAGESSAETKPEEGAGAGETKTALASAPAPSLSQGEALRALLTDMDLARVTEIIEEVLGAPIAGEIMKRAGYVCLPAAVHRKLVEDAAYVENTEKAIAKAVEKIDTLEKALEARKAEAIPIDSKTLVKSFAALGETKQFDVIEGIAMLGSTDELNKRRSLWCNKLYNWLPDEFKVQTLERLGFRWGHPVDPPKPPTPDKPAPLLKTGWSNMKADNMVRKHSTSRNGGTIPGHK